MKARATRAATVRFTPALRALTVLLGTGSFALGALAVFATQNGTGAAALIVFGGVLLILALLGSRVESLEFGGATLRLRAAAAERFELAEESERLGDTATARQLRVEARTLMDAAGPIAADYSSVRGSMRPGATRTRALEPELRNFEATLAAIAHPRTPFEQYHAMRLAMQMVDGLDAGQARRLAEAVERQRGFRFRRDSDRARLREEILQKVHGRS
ncbi:hypothetical protein DEJ45_01860 [Streptomyces venezuelae]|uniref:hypothetical protein n=1 Tax=Streptomyces venezuelae TaxID=54571 RepID=UPI0012A96166|nr:hypothetical protein [Streptomyces venezuelae]QES11292.1 hypothetical protein DEJ45_01860 [Streptomyces venezuelae]